MLNNRTVKKFMKNLKYKVNFNSISKYLAKQGFVVQEYVPGENNPALDDIDMVAYSETVRGFTYSDGQYKFVFVKSTLSHEEKLCTLLHEAAHVELEHLENKDANNSRIMEMEAETFAYTVLNYKRSLSITPILTAVIAILVLILAFSVPHNNPTTVDSVAPNVIPNVPYDIETDIETEMVYVTHSGHKYHKKHCRYVKNKKTTELTLKEAQEKYTPCSVCY